MRMPHRLAVYAIAVFGAATFAAPAAQAQAQPPPSREQSPPARPAQPQSGGVAKPQPEQTPPATGRQRRKKKSSRRSPRQPAARRQGLATPIQPVRGAEPVRRELTLAANVLVGHDDDVTSGLGTGQGTIGSLLASSSTRAVDATLGYFHGNAIRSFRFASTGNVLAYPERLQRPAAGNVTTVEGATSAGAWTVRVFERFGYEPFFDVFSPGASGVPPPPGIGPAPTAVGLFERRSRNSLTSGSVDRRWTTRDSTSLSYSYLVQRFTDHRGDNNAHDVSAQYRRRVTGATTARLTYGYLRHDYTDYEGSLRPIREHRIEGGPDIEKVLSRSRRLILSFGAGAAHSESIAPITGEPYRAWLPIGNLSLTLALSRSVSIDGGYRRSLGLLQGLTDEVYATDTASLGTRFFVTRRTSLRFGATYGSWKAVLTPGVNDRLTVYGASAQLIVPVTASIAATGSYFYYQHRYSNPGHLPVGFPGAYDRQSFRIGLTMWVPIAGTATSPLVSR